MNILHICPDFFDTPIYLNLFNSFSKKNFKSEVYVPLNMKSSTREQYYENINLIYTKIYSNMDRFVFYRKVNKIYNDVVDKIDIKNIDIIHAHYLFSSGYIAYKLNKTQNKRYVVAVRNTDVNLFFKYRINLRNLGVEILLNAEKIVFISESYRKLVLDKYIPNQFKQQIEAKSIVIPNGIDEYWFNNLYEVRRELNGRGNINLIQVGRLDKNKNIQTTIKTTIKLRQQGYNANLTIVGDGKDKAIVLKYVAKYPTFIKYKGKLNANQLLSCYRENDIFIMPSKFETFGLVYVEAMTQGLPLIYTKEQGFSSYFKEDEVGYPVTHNNEDEICEVIKRIVKSYNRLSYNCVINSKRFSWNNISKDYESMYENLYEGEKNETT